jgi:hypothetical protein
VGIAGHRTLGLIVLLLLEVIVLFLMAAYQQRRLGALPAAIAAVIAVTGGFVYALFTAPRGTTDEHAFVSGVMVTAEWLFVSLEWCWQVIVLAIIVTGVLAIIAPWRTSRAARGEPRHDPASRERLRRAALTATLSAVLPALIVLVLNIGLWNALIATGRTIVCAAQQPEARARVPSCAGRGFRHMPTPVGVLPEKADRIDQEGGQDVGDTVEALIKRSSAAFPLMLGFALIGAAIAVWALMPAVVSELPWLLRAAKWQAAWLGDAVSAGFKTLRWSGLILYALFLVLIASYAGVRVSGPISGPSWLNAPVLLSSIIALALTVSRGPFRFLALGFRSALDIALDVTNWLRMHPLHRNPRARICARYASLLRHVCEWQHPLDGSRYGAVVIVAHSQGTVITSELLAFLKKAGHPGLARLDPSHGDHLPVYLLTVGCPLRQLYGLRFPHLYAWARHGDASWPGATPAPDDLGVRHWFNAYRSGDYVGRYLWHPDTGTGRWDDDRRAHPAHPAPPDLAEQCLGAGAHTHYFDETAAEVGVILDTLISAACRHAATPEIAQR